MTRRDFRYARCRDRLEALARSGVGADEGRREAIGALRRAVGFDRWCWPTTDPDSGLSTNGIGELDFWPAIPRLVALEQHGDVTSKPALILGEQASISLSAATGGDLARSPRWRECLQPYGIGDELMTVCRDRRGCWGSVELMRDSDDPPFSADEQHLMHELAPVLGTLIRRSLGHARSDIQDGGESSLAPATLILDRDGLPVSWTASFRGWLSELNATGEMLPPSIYEIAARALTSPKAATALPNRVRVRTTSGRWATVEGALLEGSAVHHVAITIRDATTDESFDMLCKIYDLTRRERELVSLTLEGLATKQLAQALFISAYTVQDHLKSIFAKTGTRSRGELVSRLSGRTA